MLTSNIPKMTRTRRPWGWGDFHEVEYDWEHTLEVTPAIVNAPWAYDASINRAMQAGAHSEGLVAFCELRPRIMAHFESDAELDDVNVGNVGATWPEVTVELKFAGYEDDTYLSREQLSNILVHKLVWTI